MRNWFVYMMTNRKEGVLYTGVTSNLPKRVWEHKNKVSPESFTSKYNLTQLVYYESHDTHEYAIPREKQLKKWQRQWKIELIEKTNPTWRDLYQDICIGDAGSSPA